MRSLFANGLFVFLDWRMPKITDERRAAVRRRIETAALEAFVAKGFAAASMADIIEASGMSAGAIYGHFATKAELTAAVAARVIGTRVDRVEALATQEPLLAPAAALRHALDELPPEVVDSGLVLQIWGQAPLDPALQRVAVDALAAMRSALTRYLTAWLVHQGETPAQARARARKAAPAYIGLLQGYLATRCVLGAGAAQGYLDAVDLVLAER